MVSLADLGLFINSIFLAYDSYFFFAFTLMMAGSLFVMARRIIVGVKQ